MGLEDVAGADQSKPRSDAVATTYVRSTNVLCLCGLVLGLAAMFCTWTYLSNPDSFSTSLIFISSSYLSSGLGLLGARLFVLGTALAIVTPLSGLVQAGGLVAYAVSVMDRAAEMSAHSDGTIEFGLSVGFYAGVVSAALILGSLIRPLGPGFGSAHIDIARRLRVFSDGRPRRKWAYRYHGPRMRRDIAWKSKMSAAGLKGFLSSRRKWVAMLVAFMLVSLFLVLYDNDFLRDQPPLDAVEGGVVLELFRGSSLVKVGDWEYFRLSLNDSESHVGWAFQNSGLNGGVWSVLSLGKESLESLNVSLTIIDRLGDGRVGSGDKLVLTAQDGTSFAEDVVYRLHWRTNQTIAYTNPVWMGWEISFVFHGGDMDSWVSEDSSRYMLASMYVVLRY